MKKKPTKAWIEVDQYRDQMIGRNRDQFKVIAKDYSSVAYLFTNSKGKPVARIYKGRAKEPRYRYWYSSEEDRAIDVARIMALLEKKPSETTRQLAVGDVLRASWGYEQTNIDYYIVSKLIGKSMVEIQEIGKIVDYDGQDHGRCVPDINKIIGSPMKRKAHNDRVRITSFMGASKLGYKEVDGVKVFDSSYWSSYN